MILFRTANGTRSAIVGLEQIVARNTLVTLITRASGTSHSRCSSWSSIGKTTLAYSVGGQGGSARNLFIVTKGARGRVAGSTSSISGRKSTKGRTVFIGSTSSASLADTVLGENTTTLAACSLEIQAINTTGARGTLISLESVTILTANLGIVGTPNGHVNERDGGSGTGSRTAVGASNITGTGGLARSSRILELGV